MSNIQNHKGDDFLQSIEEEDCIFLSGSSQPDYLSNQAQCSPTELSFLEAMRLDKVEDICG